MSSRPRVGISSCLLGETVRWDGGHKRSPRLLERCGREIEWVAVCPEVEIGLGTPREPINLVRTNTGIALIAANTGRDVTAMMRTYAKERVDALAHEPLSGYVLKSDSPSCGLRGVRVHSMDGAAPDRCGRGLFADALIRRLPDLPIEEDERLNDPRILDDFIARVLAFHEAHHV